MQTKTNLFTAGTKVKETKKKDEKKVLPCPDLKDKIQKFSNLKQQLETTKAELAMIEGDIKSAGRVIFLDEYQHQKSTPENFKLQDETGATCLFIVMDKYTMVDASKAEVLGQYDNLLDERVEYKMNADLIDKYGEVISDFIVNCKDIAEEDKANLITGEKTFSVKKGSIDRLLQYEDPSQVFELINPICALKK